MKLTLETLSGLLTLGIIVHHLEKGARLPYWLGEHLLILPAWIKQIRTGQQFDATLFIVLVLATVLCWWAFYLFYKNPLSARNWQIFLISLLALLIDVFFSLVLSIITGSFFPGLLTGVFVIVPLAVMAIRKMMQASIFSSAELWRKFLILSLGAYVLVVLLIWVTGLGVTALF